MPECPGKMCVFLRQNSTLSALVAIFSHFVKCENVKFVIVTYSFDSVGKLELG